MPYASDKQRKFMHARHPGIASEWDEEIRANRKKKHMRLSEVQKSVMPPPRPKDDRKRKGAATGVGVVATGAGLAGGGIPGMKADRLSTDFMKPGVKPTERVKNVVRARRAGVFGYRANAHHILHDFELSEQAARRKHPGGDKVSQFKRAGVAGKKPVEQTIINHMKLGRKVSHGALAGGVGLTAYGLHRKKPEAVDKADDRRNTALLAGGGVTAAGSYGGARLLEHQGRKWAKESERHLDEAAKINPRLAGHTKRPGRVVLGKIKTPFKTKVPDVRAKVSVSDSPQVLRNQRKSAIEAAGRHRGAAVNANYFGSVYGTMGQGLRKIALPIGAGTAAVGGAGLYRNKKKREQQGIKKAYRPSYFQGSAPTERLSGENQRYRTEAQHQVARGAAAGLGAASTAALGARWAGHKNAPAAMQVAAGAARARGVPKEVVQDASAKGARLHRWAAPRRGKLLATSAALGVGGIGANTVARWKKDEITGMSQDLGRAAAGDRGQKHSKKVTKSAGTALGIEAAAHGAKRLSAMTPAARRKFYIGAASGTAGATGIAASTWAGHRARRMERENKELKASGGFTGPVMKSEGVGFGKTYASEPHPFGKALHGGSNVREYSYLPENIRQDVGFGSIGVRRNPMSALDLFASSRIMANARSHGRISRRRLTRQAHNEMTFAGGRAMLYSPTGRGSVY